MNNLDEKQRAAVNQLLQLFREQLTTLTSRILFRGTLSSIQFLADVDNGMKIIDCWEVEESDIPILIKLLASPRPDGQQRVMQFYFSLEQLPVAQKLLDAIKEV
jgi:hypothetical protein